MQPLTNRSKLVGKKKWPSGNAYTFRLFLVECGLPWSISSGKNTVRYPEVQREFSQVYRGQHVLKRDENGAERCTACGLCAVACPAEAITMTAAERKPGEENLYREEKYAAIYEINMLRCIFAACAKKPAPKKLF